MYLKNLIIKKKLKIIFDLIKKNEDYFYYNIFFYIYFKKIYLQKIKFLHL